MNIEKTPEKNHVAADLANVQRSFGDGNATFTTLPWFVHRRVCTRPNENHPHCGINCNSSPSDYCHTLPESPLCSMWFPVQNEPAAIGWYHFWAHTRRQPYHYWGLYWGETSEESDWRRMMSMLTMRCRVNGHFPFPEEENNCNL